VIAAEAAAMKLSRMKLSKKDEDTARSGGEDFDTPHRSVSESSSDDMSGAGSSDASSGLRSIATESIGSRHSQGKNKTRKRTIESKVAKKITKLYDLILACVSDEIAMKIARKAKGDGLEALRLIEKMYASSEVDRAEDLRSEMKDLDPDHFVCFGEYMEAILQTQSKLEVIGKPLEEAMVRVFIRDKAPVELKAFIATISRDGDLGIEDWVLEIQKFDKTLHKSGKMKDPNDLRTKIACQTRKYGGIEVCQLCDAPDHSAKECKRWLGEKRTCYNCGERGHLSRDCTKPRIPREDSRYAKAEDKYMKARKAFKVAKVKANKASKKKKKVKLAPSPQPSSSSDSSEGENSETSTPSSTSGDDEDSSSSAPRVVDARKAKVRHGKSYLEAASPSNSDDSHLSWDEYNMKTAKAGKLTRSRSWDEGISTKEKMDLMGKLAF
jgi:hypothetical protein